MGNEFKIGDYVVIDRNSKYFNSNHKANPRYIIGIINSTRNYNIYVEWLFHLSKNVYHHNDLKLVDKNDIVKELKVILENKDISIHTKNNEERIILYKLLDFFKIKYYDDLAVLKNFEDLYTFYEDSFLKQTSSTSFIKEIKNLLIVEFQDLINKYKLIYEQQICKIK